MFAQLCRIGGVRGPVFRLFAVVAVVVVAAAGGAAAAVVVWFFAGDRLITLIDVSMYLFD